MMNGLTNLALLAANPLEKVVDQAQLKVGGFPLVTNHMILLILSGLILLLVLPAIAASYKRSLVPGGFAGFFEAIIAYLRDQTVRPVLGDDTDRYMPFLLTMFFFILVNNILGLLPLYELTYWFTNIGLYPVYGTATGNLAVTFILAVASFVVIQIHAFEQNGVKGYLRHLTAGAPAYMWPIMVPVEIIGVVVKPFALMMRLFANMLAGGIVLKTLVGFVGLAAGLGIAGVLGVGVPIVLASAAMMILKLFVALLQAFLFLFLTSIFISQWTYHHDDHHGDGHHMPPHEHESLPAAAINAGTGAAVAH